VPLQGTVNREEESLTNKDIYNIITGQNVCSVICRKEMVPYGLEMLSVHCEKQKLRLGIKANRELFTVTNSSFRINQR
jgi:hypothetical protein